MEGPVLEEAQLFSGPTSPLGSPEELSKMLMSGSPPQKLCWPERAGYWHF